MVVFVFVGMLMHNQAGWISKPTAFLGGALCANVVSEFFGCVPHSPKSVDPIGNWKL